MILKLKKCRKLKFAKDSEHYLYQVNVLTISAVTMQTMKTSKLLGVTFLRNIAPKGAPNKTTGAANTQRLNTWSVTISRANP